MVCILAGFTVTTVHAFTLITTVETVIVDEVEVDVVKMADNFIILYDTSSSMGDQLEGMSMTKLQAEKKILMEKNRQLPDLGFNAGLYTFTPASFSFQSKTLKPFYKVQPYDKEAFAKAIEQLPEKASGPTLLQQGLLELDSILSGLTGRTVVVVVSDGAYSTTGIKKKPVDIARELAKKHNVCFIIASTAKTEKNAQVLEAVASISPDSRVIPFDQLLGKPEYLSGVLFVLEERLVKKSIDVMSVIGIDLNSILFYNDSALVKPEYFERLKILGDYLKANPDFYAVFAGFADSTGTQEYNMDLSRRRAEAVKAYLVNSSSVNPKNIVLQWYGEALPVGDNDTPQGRNLNRRVKGVVVTM